ncbi:MAG: hypothetical protein HY886_02470 [Deltaproteobacteria bacterium]|nr:hypothetical protein [Deltaproteobacteria bacterium]
MFLDYLHPSAGKTAVGLLALVALLPAWRVAECGELKATPSISIDERYDTNPYGRSRTEAVDPDFVTKLAPSLSAAYDARDAKINAAYRLNAAFYSQRSPYSSIGHNLNLGLNTEISNKTTMSLNNVYNHAKTSVYDADEIHTGFDTVSTDALTASAEHKIDARLTATIALSENFYVYKASDKIDSRRDGAAFGGRYDAGNDRLLSASYGYGNTVFETPGGANTTETHTIRAGLADNSSRTMNFNLGAGAVYNPDRESGRYDWNGDAGVAGTFERSSATLSYKRGIAHGAGLVSEQTTSETVSAGWKTEMSNDLGLDITGSTNRNRSKPEHTIDAKSYNAGASVRWKAYSWLNAAIGYSRMRQWGDGAVETRDVEQDAVFITLTATGAEWRGSL